MDFFIRPAGPADAEAIAEVQRVSWQAAYRDLLTPESLARVATAWDSVHWRSTLERVDDPIVNLVLDSRQTGVAGFGVAGPRRRTRDQALATFDAEIYLLYLMPGVQRHGHGAEMMRALARVLQAQGKHSVLVWALTGNRPAIAFYRRLSGAIMAQTRRPFFGETVTETALGWRDIALLAGMSRNLKE
jgi:ribosomal protein S18 acetylase RimI-like enzyme